MITFVCLGNICRSAMLHKIFAHYVGTECESAGLLDQRLQMTEYACAVLQENGIQDTLHVSKPITQAIYDRSDLIISMTDRIRDKLVARYGEGKVTSMSSPQLLGREVDDPYGCGIEAYRRVYADFMQVLPKLSALAESLR